MFQRFFKTKKLNFCFGFNFFLQYAPFMMKRIRTDGTIEWFGLVFDIMNELAVKLNFT